MLSVLRKHATHAIECDLMKTLLFVFILCTATLASAGDWPMARHDARRSAVTDEQLTFPLRLQWRYVAAQPPAPAWPEPIKNANRTDFDYAAHPVVAGDTVYFASSADDTLRALDATNGKPRWQFTAGGPLRFAPQVVGNRVYIGGDDGIAYCLDAETGKRVWSYRGGPSPDMLLGNGRMISRWPIRTGVLVDDGVLYFVAGMWPSEGIFIYALDAATGKLIWCNDTSGHVPVRVVGHSVDDTLAGICPQGALLATADKLVVPMGRSTPATFDRKTGKLLRFEPGDNNGSGGTALTIDGDYCYIPSNNFYSPTAINAFPLDTMMYEKPKTKLVQMPTLSLPNSATFYRGRQYSVFGRRVVTIVSNNTMTARFAEGIARAGSSLVLGYDGSVAAEDSVGKRAANIRMAIAGSDMAIFADVVDRKMIRDVEKPWKGSCVEVFISTQPSAPVGQVMMIPALGDAPAACLVPRGEKPALAPEVRVITTPTPTGYQLRALIPLATLGLKEKPTEFTLECQITTVTDVGRQNRDTLFGSLSPSQTREKYGKFTVASGPETGGKPNTLATLTPIASLDAVEESLAKQTSMTIGVTDQAEVWRAPVQGKALGIAVANGRLIVSTDSGEISCFASQESGDANAPTLNARAAQIAAFVPTPAEAAVVERVRAAGMDRGYALTIGDSEGRFSQALATLRGLRVIAVVPDENAADSLRQKLIESTRLYGTRIHVVVADRVDALPLPRYFANAVIVAAPTPGLAPAELFRVLHPVGGVLLMPGLPAADAQKIADSITATKQDQTTGDKNAVTRGRLDGAWDWDSTGTGDKLVRWPLRPIWFGGTGPAKTHNRKFQGPTLAAANGIFFENSDGWITAVDAYNGTELWSRAKPLQIRESLPYGSALTADDKNVYFLLSTHAFRGKGRGCVVLDARTGRQLQVFAPWTAPPVVELTKPQTWAMVPERVTTDKNAAPPPGQAPLPPIGSATLERDEQGLTFKLTSDFAPAQRRVEWQIYLDARPPAQRFGLFDPGVWAYRISPSDAAGKPATWSQGNGQSHPPITLTSTPVGKGTLTTVRLLWADLPGSNGKAPASFGFALELSQLLPDVDLTPITAYLFGDEFANGINNGWANIVLDSAASKELAVRPAVVAGRIEGDVSTATDLEPDGVLAKSKLGGRSPSLDLRAVSAPRVHPLTGQQVERLWTHGDGCGASAFSATAVVARAANAGIYDFVDDSGLRTFPGVRSSCGSSMMSALGVWYMANGGTGCECTYSFLSQVALAPADHRLNEDWAVFSEWKADTQVRKTSLNFGAPGDRRDPDGALWLAFPRPPRGYVASVTNASGAYNPASGVWIGSKGDAATPIPLEIDGFEGASAVRVNTDRVTIGGTDRPWIYGSALVGVRKATLTLQLSKPLIAVSTEKPVATDGKLTDDAWKNAPQVELPTTKSTIAFSVDANNLYIACRRPTAIDRKGAVRQWNTSTPPVFHFTDTWEVFLSDAKGQTVVHLGTTAGGQRHSAVATGMTGEKIAQIAGSRSAAVADDKDGFVAEFEVPLATLTNLGLDKDSLAVNARIGDHPIVGEAIARLGSMAMQRCQGFVALGLGKAPPSPERLFGVRLHFAELTDAAVGQRVFDVKLQGKTVLKDFDIVAAGKGARNAVVKEFAHVTTAGTLEIEFVPATKNATTDSAPLLSGLEVWDEAGAKPQE